MVPYKISDTITIRALVDVSSVEVFVDGGKLAMTEIFFPSEDFSRLKIFSEGGNVLLNRGEIFQMNSFWQ
jgi:sucrose-6-phosphate hydrolase SacC (GH32 family)